MCDSSAPMHTQEIKAEEGGCWWSNKSYLLTGCLTTTLRKAQLQWEWVKVGRVWTNVFICMYMCLRQWGLKAEEISISGRLRASQHLSGVWSGLWFPQFTSHHQISSASLAESMEWKRSSACVHRKSKEISERRWLLNKMKIQEGFRTNDKHHFQILSNALWWDLNFSASLRGNTLR